MISRGKIQQPTTRMVVAPDIVRSERRLPPAIRQASASASTTAAATRATNWCEYAVQARNAIKTAGRGRAKCDHVRADKKMRLPQTADAKINAHASVMTGKQVAPAQSVNRPNVRRS